MEGGAMIAEITMTVQMPVDDFMAMTGRQADPDGVYRGTVDLYRAAQEAVLFRLSNGGMVRGIRIAEFTFQIRSQFWQTGRGPGGFFD
jgi:hypothetical protein